MGNSDPGGSWYALDRRNRPRQKALERNRSNRSERRNRAHQYPDARSGAWVGSWLGWLPPRPASPWYVRLESAHPARPSRTWLPPRACRIGGRWAWTFPPPSLALGWTCQARQTRRRHRQRLDADVRALIGRRRHGRHLWQETLPLRAVPATPGSDGPLVPRRENPRHPMSVWVAGRGLAPHPTRRVARRS